MNVWVMSAVYFSLLAIGMWVRTEDSDWPVVLSVLAAISAGVAAR
jgi:hypothetical protein